MEQTIWICSWLVGTIKLAQYAPVAAALAAAGGFLQAAPALAGACRHEIAVLSTALLAIVCLTIALWAAGCRQISADERLSSLLVREGC
jgi:hypothetical protein